MKVLVACEFSGVVRDAFLAQGADAYSCDLRPALINGIWSKHPRHIRGNVLEILNDGWDLMIAHPPCTYLALSGIRHAPLDKQQEALDFVRFLLWAPIPRICVENPQSIIQTRITHYNQNIHPWMFGDPYQKETWLWLKNLPNLKPIVTKKPDKVLPMRSTGGSDRSLIRSITYPGIAQAMASQWITPGPLK